MATDRLPIEPRCIPASEAAAYCGLTPGGFRHWVAIGRLPPTLPGTRRWDRKAIDDTLDQISGLPTAGTPDSGENDLDQWLHKHREREACESASNHDPITNAAKHFAGRRNFNFRRGHDRRR